MLFKDRIEAGKKLAEKLRTYANREDVLLLALPRGGVILGHEMRKELNLPLDILLVRKLGVPWQEELALGAIALDNVRYLNKNIVTSLGIPEDIIEKIVTRERQELERRNKLYRGDKPFPEIKNKIIILIDDGIATGATMRAAIKALQCLQPQKIIVAAPVASQTVYRDFKDEQVELVILETPEPFFGIGMWYQDFAQITDEEVIKLLHSAKESTHE